MEHQKTKDNKPPIRVRFAPSPTGYLHLGGARTALYNWLFARGNGGTFVLRIEDTDENRSKGIFVRHILEDMRWLGLDWDEGPEKEGRCGPYFQSQRKDHYKRHCEALIASGKAYYCFCKVDELEQRRRQIEQTKAVYGYDGRCRNITTEDARHRLESGEPAAVRFKVPSEGYTEFRDLIRKRLTIPNKELEDFIIVRSDGTPTYNFTVVADDLEMEITHVIRGDDHISNTPKQILLYHGLGASHPLYAHIPMILGPDGTRLSKRHGATAINTYRQMGFVPDAMINYLALLGWSFDGSQTLFTTKELIEKFSLRSVGKKAATFDNQKLLWMNGVYIRNYDIDALTPLCIPYLEERFGKIFTQDLYLKKILSLVQVRIKQLPDVVELTSYFWEDSIEYQPDAKAKLTGDPRVSSILESLQARFTMLKSFTHKTIEETCLALADEMGLKLGALAHPVRAAVTGRTASPGLFEILEILGRQKVLNRLKKALCFIEKENSALL